ncbi:hypothetical protein Huta_2717 [Halorhabdus utahensis DSM 12940]|uniref:Lipoprotein n=1 Tax=Halorhabdus utahensis (strain DSM 12940 / JCM 11049 / AX-2) TaxID=519442 RepID=C7NQF2_HALUD|nr:hypothetical protein [Halorhabdus utahensis]ACV12878.1 hypothetical protein Huta_2717 [Halorhabdus utahensis DSM 12940]
MGSRVVLTVSVLLLFLTAGCLGLGDDPDVPTVTPAAVPDEGTPEQVVPTAVTTEQPATFTPENLPTAGPLQMSNQASTPVALWRLRSLLSVTAIEPTVDYRLGPMIDPGPDPLSLSDSITAALGPDVSADGGTLYGRVDSANATIHLVKGMHGSAQIEYHLAYFHTQVLQERLGWTASIPSQANSTLDERLVAFGLRRGAAALAADAYAEEYSLSIEEQIREWDFAWQESSWLARGALDAGYDYAEGRTTSPDSLAGVYANPPNTTEQLRYGLPPESEPPRPLNVTVSGDGDWERTATERFGELGIRALLSTRLDREAAGRAVRGWGTDRLLAFENGTASGVVWVTTWDQASYADQFAAGFERYAAAGDPPQASQRTRSGPKTVVVTAGSPAFVDGVAVAGDNESVSISLPD